MPSLRKIVGLVFEISSKIAYNRYSMGGRLLRARSGPLPPPRILEWQKSLKKRRPPRVRTAWALGFLCFVEETWAAAPAYVRWAWSNSYCGPFVLALAPLRCAPLRLSAMTYGDPFFSGLCFSVDARLILFIETLRCSPMQALCRVSSTLNVSILNSQWRSQITTRQIVLKLWAKVLSNKKFQVQSFLSTKQLSCRS